MDCKSCRGEGKECEEEELEQGRKEIGREKKMCRRQRVKEAEGIEGAGRYRRGRMVCKEGLGGGGK